MAAINPANTSKDGSSDFPVPDPDNIYAGTYVKIHGIVRTRESYTNSETDKTYHSVNLDVEGHRMPIQVSLHSKPSPAAYPVGKRVSVNVIIQPLKSGVWIREVDPQ